MDSFYLASAAAHICDVCSFLKRSYIWASLKSKTIKLRTFIIITFAFSVNVNSQSSTVTATASLPATDVPIVNLSPFSSKLSLLLSPSPHLQLSLSTYSLPATDAQIINLSSKSPSLPLSPTLSQLCRSIGHHHHQQVFKCFD